MPVTGRLTAARAEFSLSSSCAFYFTFQKESHHITGRVNWQITKNCSFMPFWHFSPEYQSISAKNDLRSG
ncbi:hypothetical protein EHJ07_09810 [Cronobacter muytjensii]|uniref:Uncharacterized protein n=1 Tax=Cronobacter muytjensii TaxID=413501 RepID=A0A2T7B0K2_9ENTR|nr:hypothetical protein [Cronobacter muytjensii]KAB0873863.1 hypothetical protein FZI19_18385 [Cronobacter muytjensii]NCH56480.1 hypothetical protein [Cronobacter muytjensii]NCI16781.1 hypothetical protein [Cronobacter muytjensii]PUX18523.1 hypothetical protein AUN14_00140 [Cronobacter muytjensii]